MMAPPIPIKKPCYGFVRSHVKSLRPKPSASDTRHQAKTNRTSTGARLPLHHQYILTYQVFTTSLRHEVRWHAIINIDMRLPASTTGIVMDALAKVRKYSPKNCVQPELLHEIDPYEEEISILMPLFKEYYDLIWKGQKIFEYRRRLVHAPSRWYVYLNPPVRRVIAIIRLQAPIIASPLDIADLADTVRPGDGPAVWRYLKDLRYGYAALIRSATEYPGLSHSEINRQIPAFKKPNELIRLDHAPALRECVDLIHQKAIRHLEFTPVPSLELMHLRALPFPSNDLTKVFAR